MKFKAPEMAEQLERSDHRLKWVLDWLDTYVKEKYGAEITVTCVERSRKETLLAYASAINPLTGQCYEPDDVPFSPHESRPCRAADVRSRDFTVGQCKEIEGALNKEWRYDMTRPNKRACIYHDVAGPHFHVQCHPKTVRAA